MTNSFYDCGLRRSPDCQSGTGAREIKSGRGVRLQRAELGSHGLSGDRRWLVVDDSGKFVTQRSHPNLAMVTAQPEEGGLRLSAPNMPDLPVEQPAGNSRLNVRVWEDQVDAANAGPDANGWISEFFEEDLTLVYMDEQAAREKAGPWTEMPVRTSFADSYSLLVTTSGSLTALNTAISEAGGTPVPMTRFRPNIVIDCDDPWQEDKWKSLRIGNTEIELVRPCERCVVTTRDQETGESTGKEPLVTLARLRRSGDPRVNEGPTAGPVQYL
jgi:uncharacterized protein